VEFPSFTDALRFWLKLGFISFGGPTGQIAIMHEELVQRRRWLSKRRFLHALNYCMVLPGPEAQQLATYIGWLMHGTCGGLAAGILFVLPSLFILIGLTWIYLAFGHTPLVASILYGVKPAVTAIVLAAAARIGTRALAGPLLWGIAAAAFIALLLFHVPFPLIILGAAAIGYLGGRLDLALLGAVASKHELQRPHAPALIDDDTPTPSHAHFDASRFLRYALTGLSLWLGIGAMLLLLFGWQGTLTQMDWFFTKAALVTFGGAYAVLPYVQQAAVDHYGWLTAAQMIDGLALGETTPGPLIMVVAFVGFVGAWTHAVFGADALLLSGIAGAVVATVATFLPSLLFILLGAPLVERTRGDLGLAAPLTAITAAVVGVIANLAAYFAYHTLWPQGIAAPYTASAAAAGFEWPAALIGAAALLALTRYKLNVIPVILACGLAGMALSIIS
jgi:chromate transporter